MQNNAKNLNFTNWELNRAARKLVKKILKISSVQKWKKKKKSTKTALPQLLNQRYQNSVDQTKTSN